LANRRLWADVGRHSPDGICLDAAGAAWYADVGNRCCVRVGEGGEVLNRVQLDPRAVASLEGQSPRCTKVIGVSNR
ncbi:MAG TPA: SMP-30/gluconolactonase/LRE family protein, partial [Mycobacterium sp.]